MQPLPTMTWRAAVILWVAAVVASIPFVYLQPSLAAVHTELPSSESILGMFAVAYAVAALIGWAMGSRVGFGAPFIEAWLKGTRPEVRPLLTSAGFGAVLAIAAVVTLLGMFGNRMPSGPGDEASVMSDWLGFVFVLHGGVSEEVVFRFGLLSGIAWVIAQLRRLVHSWEAAPNEAMAAWGGIVISSILFGLYHAGMGPGPLLIQASFRIAAGLLFGWLFWQRGIESAMAAHLAYDLVVFYVIVAVV